MVATAETSQNSGGSPQRIRVSAMKELNIFSGKDRDEDKARSWISKVKSAFLRDQAPDEEKCFMFGDLLLSPARNWYNQLSRSTRHKWKQLLNCFMIQYGGDGVSVARQYYLARKRSDEPRWSTCIAIMLLQNSSRSQSKKKDWIPRPHVANMWSTSLLRWMIVIWQNSWPYCD